ncbi:hypothetical protein JXA32_17565, partial [Candidatus Sumerlaeota bacterium]|nr:hypothetical protein [Candidatus Sumerlaeota bacterium]
YDFNETTGVTLEDKAPEGTRNDASVIGDTLTSRTVTGLIGQAYSKPANLTSYVTADTTADNIDQLYTHPDIQFGDNATGTDFTINSWIKVYGPSSGGKRTMGSVNFNESSSALRNGVSILSDGNTSFRWRLHTTSSSSLDTSERTTMSSTNYRMMSYVMTRGNGANGAGQVKIYVDGVLASTNNPAAAMTGAITGNDGHMAWRFGQDLATYTQADFDEFGVWKRALSASELQQIYSMGNAGQCLLDIVPSPTITISDDRDAEYYTDNVSTPTYTVIVTVTNNGVLPLTIEPQSFTGSDSGEFAFAGSYDETTSKTILPGYSLDIPIVWTWATPEETKDAFLSFDHNDALNGSHSDYALDLVLTHIEPSLTVTDNAETLYYRDDATTFGITVTVTNDSPGQLNIGARSLSSPDAAQFAFANDESSPVTLNSADPDETYDIDVVWTWDGTADYTTSFTVTFDNNVEPDYATTYTVTVELGTRPAVISVTDDAESIYYADQPGPYYFNVIVSNPSLGTLVIEPQSFGGADAAQFDFASSWDESTSRSIAPSGSLNIPVVWTPESVGVVTSATLSFDHNDATNGSHTDYGLELVQQSRDSQYLTLQNDLVIYYHFNETSGNVISDYALTDGAQDASVIGRAMDLATTTGIVYQDKYSVNGAFHDTTGTLNFAAIDNVADDSYTTTGFVSQLQFGDQASGTDFSISTWIKPVNLFDGNLRLMGDIDFTISYSVAGRAGIAILCDGDNGVGNAYSSSRFRIQNLANTTRYDLYGGVFDDFANVTYGETPEWRMLTLTMDRSGGENGTGLATVYCDGLVVNETSVAADFTGSMDGNIAWMFGRDINTGDAIVAFDEFAVWHRAIADSEVKYIYSAGIRGYEFTDPASYVPPKPDPSATQRNLWEVLQ